MLQQNSKNHSKDETKVIKLNWRIHSSLILDAVGILIIVLIINWHVCLVATAVFPKICDRNLRWFNKCWWCWVLYKPTNIIYYIHRVSPVSCCARVDILMVWYNHFNNLQPSFIWTWIDDDEWSTHKHPQYDTPFYDWKCSLMGHSRDSIEKTPTGNTHNKLLVRVLSCAPATGKWHKHIIQHVEKI